MDLEDFKNNKGHAYVVGLSFCFPPRYACFKESYPPGWMWTSELAEAETFVTKESALMYMKQDMAALVDGNEDVKVLKVEMKVGPA